MTISELHARLSQLMARGFRDASIVFGPEGSEDNIPVEGGVFGQHENRPTLILAPIKLDQVGGF